MFRIKRNESKPYSGLLINLFFAIFLIPLVLTKSSADYKNWCDLYFTSPAKTGIKIGFNTPETAIIRKINNAKKSFYGAFYEISSPAVLNALIDAKKRGLIIKIVTERDNMGGFELNRLIKAGIPLVSDNRGGLMHNKFAVIDNENVWTGSYNLTLNGAKLNNNNAIMIHSKELAEIYLTEFNEMFNSKIFGNRKEYGPFADFRKKYYVKIRDTDVNVYFSPEDDIERIILKRLRKARASIHFMAFSFTSDKIGEAMIYKFKRGIMVYGIFEKRGVRSRYSEYIKMKIEGLPVRLDRNRSLMHHKVIIIDNATVITGSYNFSKNANRKNDENILIIHNKEIAAQYLKEFYRLY